MEASPAASRIARLSDETTATFIVFDCLLRKLGQLLPQSVRERRAAAGEFFEG